MTSSRRWGNEFKTSGSPPREGNVMRMGRIGVAALAAVALVGCNRDLKVRTVSQLFGSPVAGIQVQVDDGAWMATDVNGEVTFHGVGDAFALRAHQVVAANPPGLQ